MAVPARPTPMDLTMHTMAQNQPALLLHIGVNLHLEGTAPPLAALRAHVSDHLHRLPRLTHYLAGPGLKARWTHDPAPDLDRRIREHRVPPGQAALDTALQDLLTHPLPDNGPPWDLWLLHGYAPDRYVLCYRTHHTTHDGGGVINTLHTLFGTAPPPIPAARAPRATLRAYTRTLKGMLSSLNTNDCWDDPAHPLHGNRASAWAQVPTETLRATGAARGGSANDALLAALAGALRAWSREHWPRITDRPVPAVMMVDLSRPGERHRPGNAFTFSPVALPVDLPTPDARLDAVIAATRGPKDRAQRAAMRTITDHTPARAFHTLASRLTSPSRAIVDTSHVVFPEPLHLHGTPVVHIQGFTWLPRHHPVSVAACTYNGTTSVYFVTDQALPGLHRVPALWEQAASQALPAH
ncbi:wax ester/triacylglycerol synthase domain-containing protein [Streptomyces sp. NBC_01803]|uniref:wax ester/triacylglycerol synthase domain-containing protein n=1 Tax=Streptomyces sp. NBC_01803 TaxID=2975946 RepID=UPI002DD81780|nr:wax ester/triacylglycerol synthase domain-containing protein [Streptomyces sp. NBC_01803]WSA42999.1 WS/DGAT domain-containing protein [Streptomyces sp. NBC_01803]